MKLRNLIFFSLLSLLLLAGCTSQRQLLFSGKDWFVSNHFAEILDTDSLYRFTLNKELVYSETPLIGKAESAYFSHAMGEYLQEILKLSRIENGEILLYVPKYSVLFVELDKNEPPIRPLSVSCQLSDSLPATFWVRPWEDEKWERQDNQMYTNIYRDKGKKLITVVDRFMYGDVPMARISIIQSATKKLKKKFPNHEIEMNWMDINKPESLDALSYWINCHRETSFENYKLGKGKNFR